MLSTEPGPPGQSSDFMQKQAPALMQKALQAILFKATSDPPDLSDYHRAFARP
jgi:hypothetical protein